MKPGDTVRFAEPFGSWGIVEAVTHYDADTYYVRWYYGLDAKGEPWTALSAVRGRNLCRLPRAAFCKHAAMSCFSDEQRELRKATLCE